MINLEKDNDYKKMSNNYLGVDLILPINFLKGSKLKEHWHEYLQVFYFIDGRGFLRCNKKNFIVNKNSIAIINSKELHYIESMDDDFKFYIIRIDLTFLFSNYVDLCQAKYLSPLSQNYILFKNLIENDEVILNCINSIIKEYLQKGKGYELAVKSHLYNLIVLLIRNYIDEIITENQLTFKFNKFKRFQEVFEYIDINYNKKIYTTDLANIAHVSSYYFCRIFKEITGRTTTEYVNDIRLKKAIELLKTKNMTITEIAINCGFNDVNYFCRLFKNKYNICPTKFKC